MQFEQLQKDMIAAMKARESQKRCDLKSGFCCQKSSDRRGMQRRYQRRPGRSCYLKRDENSQRADRQLPGRQNRSDGRISDQI